MSWVLPITEEELRQIESTPGMLESIEAGVNRELMEFLSAEIARMTDEAIRGMAADEPVGFFFPPRA